MGDYRKRFIEDNYFKIEYNKSSKQEEYYNLSFGTDSSRAIITCHKKHLDDLLTQLAYRDYEYFSDCDICGKDINLGDEYYNLGGEHIHKDCIDEYLDIAE